MDIDQKAAKVQRLANDRFAAETKGVSHYEWRDIADQIAAEVFGNEWEWIESLEVGGNITFAVTRYRRPLVS